MAKRVLILAWAVALLASNWLGSGACAATSASANFSASPGQFAGGSAANASASYRQSGMLGIWFGQTSASSASYLGGVARSLLTYDGNGNDSGAAPLDNNPYPAGTPITLAGNTGNLGKTGYSFAGWNTLASGGGTSYGPGSSYVIGAANATLYARWKSSNANLIGLTSSGGSLSPAFSSGILSYAYSVINSVTSVTVTPTLADSSASVTVNQNTVASGSASGTIPLNVGSNPIKVAVTAQDGTTRTYTITVTRLGQADLSVAMTHSGNFGRNHTGAFFSITVSNAGGLASDGGTVTVTDMLPAGLTATALTGSGWNCVLGTLSCSRSGALDPGAGYPAITLTVSVAGNAPARLVNTAVLSDGGDPNSANNSVSNVIGTAPNLTPIFSLLLD